MTKPAYVFPIGHADYNGEEIMGDYIEVTGFGALNLDYVYEVADLELIRNEGFELYPGGEISGTPDDAAALHRLCEEHGRLLARSGGGSAANTITVLAALGHKTAFIGSAGDDAEGEFIVESMKGVDCARVVHSGISGQCIVLIDSMTRDRALFVVPGSAVPEISPNFDLSGTKILHMSSLAIEEGPQIQERLVSLLSPGQWLSFDPGELYAKRGMDELAPLLARTDILFVTQDELCMLDSSSGGYAVYQRLNHGKNAPLMVVKQGARGAAAFIRGQDWFVPAVPVKSVVDNTGAGDAFAAGFLHALLEKRPVPECLSEGARIASVSLGGYGRNWLGKLAATSA